MFNIATFMFLYEFYCFVLNSLYYFIEENFFFSFFYFYFSFFIYIFFSTAQQGDPVTHTCIHSFQKNHTPRPGENFKN